MKKLRNTMAVKLANFALNHIATPWYRDRVALIISLGVEEYIKVLEEEYAQSA